MKQAIIEAETTVNVTLDQARQWFMELETHPDRYQFATHAGFAFTQGNFGEAGARFQTWERFYGLRLNLHFELRDIGTSHFEFHLLRPPLPVWGAFVLEAIDARTTSLRLEVGGTTRMGAWLLGFPIVKGAIQRQIQGEIQHIRESMETIYV